MTFKQKAALRWAVREARSNRGMHTGGPPEKLAAFDRNLAYCDAALKSLVKVPVAPE